MTVRSVGGGGEPGTAPRPGPSSSPVRVAVVITRLEGGAGVMALRGAQAMDPARFQPTLIAGSGGQLADEARQAGLELLIEPHLHAEIAPLGDLAGCRRLETLFRERQFDVVHTNCAKAGAVGRTAARRAGVARIVHTFHGLPFHQFQSRARRAAYVTIERRLGRCTDLGLCVGAGVAAEVVRQRLLAPDRVGVVGVCVDGPARDAAHMSARMPEQRHRARAALGLPDDGRVVGVVGRLTYQKAPEDFLAAMTDLRRPDVTGVWVGGGELADRIERRARALRGAGVVLAGQRQDVLGLLPAFDVFALPSLYEGLPTVIVEAMIAGVPVVATAVNSVPDLVVPGETGLLVPPHRPGTMAAAIGRLLDSPALAARLAENAAARLGDQYREKALAAALAAAYEPGRAEQSRQPE